MIDHVTFRVADVAEARRFYDLAFDRLALAVDRVSDEWGDFSINPATSERPPTRRVHIGFRVGSRSEVDEWWRALTRAGYASDGAPGPRPVYAPGYYGAFVLDPAGNSVEAVHNPPLSHDSVFDHIWLRVRDLGASTAFYEAVAPTVGHRVRLLGDRTQVRGDGPSVSLVEGSPTAHLHIAFAAADPATVQAFHEAGIAAGYRSLGEPGERPQYHAGYYGAFLEDPDGNNVEAVHHDRNGDPSGGDLR